MSASADVARRGGTQWWQLNPLPRRKATKFAQRRRPFSAAARPSERSPGRARGRFRKGSARARQTGRSDAARGRTAPQRLCTCAGELRLAPDSKVFGGRLKCGVWVARARRGREVMRKIFRHLLISTLRASAELFQPDSESLAREAVSVEKEIALLPRRAAAQSRFPKNRRSDPGGAATFACTRSGCLFCIPKRVPAAAHPRSARTHFRKSLAYPRRDAVPFGFCSGGFSSTSSLRSGQRGSTEVERRSLPGGRSFPLERRRVFIRAARMNLPTHPAQAFRLRRERQWQQLNRRLLSSSIASPQCLPISSPVTAPVRTATGGGLYAGEHGVSRLFFEKFFRPFSAEFSPLPAIQKVHPQPISTGGNFMRELSKNSRPVFLRRARGSR